MLSALAGTLLVSIPPPAFAASPPALDGHGSNSCYECGTTISASLTTTGTSDVILALAFVNTLGGAADCSSVSASGLTFNPATIDTVQASQRDCLFYAQTTSTFSGSIKFTVTASTAINVIVLGVSGAITTGNPFDTGSGVGTTRGTSGTTHTTNSFSTIGGYDFLLEFDEYQGDSAASALGGYSAIANPTVPSWSGGFAEYETVTSTLSSVTASNTIGTGNSGNTGIEAILANVPTSVLPIDITFNAVNGGVAQTVTVSSCSPSPGTISSSTIGTTTDVTVYANCLVTLAVPYGYHWTTASTVTSCAAGTCSTFSATFELGPHDPGLVQQNSGSGSSVTSYSLVFGNSVTSGDMLIVAVASGGTVSSVTDTLTTPFKLYESGNDGHGDYASIYAFTAPSSGSDTVTISFASTTAASFWAYEVSHLSLQGINFNVGSGTSTTTSCGGGQQPSRNSTIVSIAAGVGVDALSSYSAGSSFTSSGLLTNGGAQYLTELTTNNPSLTIQEGSATVAAPTVQWESACIFIPNNRAASGYTVGNLHAVVGTDVSPLSTQGPEGNKVFFAQGLWWLFYSNGTSGSAGLWWRTSKTGTTWSSATQASTTAYQGDSWAVWNNSTAVWYVGAGQTSNFVYRYGVLLSSGGITWRISQSTAGATAGKSGSDNNPTIAVDTTNKNVWVALRSQDAHNYFNILVWQGSSYGSSWARSLDLNMSSDGTSVDHSAQIWTYQGSAAGDVGVYAGTFAGGSTSDVLLDFTTSTGVWGPSGCTAPCAVQSSSAGISFTHMEPHRGGVVVVNNVVYVGSACRTGATDECFWRHNFGNTTAMSGASFQDFPPTSSQTSGVADYLHDTMAFISTDGSGDFDIFFAQSWEQGTSTQVYVMKSSNSGTTWGAASVVAQNENAVWGAPSLVGGRVTNGTGTLVIWASSFTNAVVSQSASAFQMRYAWVPLAPTVTLPIDCTVAESGAPSSSSFVVSGGSPSPSPSTISCSTGSGTTTLVTVRASASITVTAPSSGSSSRYMLGTSTTTSTTSCSSSTCSTWAIMAEYEVENTWQATPLAKTTWDTVYSLVPTGTVGGIPGSSICTISTATGGGAASCSGWSDYSSNVTFPSPLLSSPSNTRRVTSGTVSYSPASGGNTENANYYEQLQNSYDATPSSPSSWDSVYDLPVTGTIFGVSGQTGCTIMTSNGGGVAACTAYFDYDASVSLPSSFNDVTSGAWNGVAPTSFTQITGGNINNVAYVQQYQISFAASPASDGTVSPSGTNIWENLGALPVAATPNLGYEFAYWTATGAITFANSASASTIATVSGTGTITATFDPLPTVTASASPSMVDSGQSSVLTATGSGGSGVYTYAWYQSTCSGSTISTSNPYNTPAQTSTTTYCVELTDSLGGLATTTVTVTVDADPTVAVAPAGPLTYDVGQSTSGFTATVTYTGPNTVSVEWYSSATSSCSASSTDTGTSGNRFVPGTSNSGTAYYCAVVLDSGLPSYSSASNAVEVSVNPAPAAPSISASPSAIDVGQSATLSTTASFNGGTPPYGCQWLVQSPSTSTYSDLGSPFSCSLGSMPSASTGILPATGTWSFELQVTDSGSPFETVTSNVVTVAVNPAPSVTITPSNPTVDNGQSLTLVANPTGGTGGYSYAWYQGSVCSGTVLGVSSTYNTGPLVSSTTFCAQVTDSLGATAMNTVTATVDADPTIAVTPAGPFTYDIGQTATGLTAAVTYSGPNSATVEWYISLTSSCSSSSTDTHTSGMSFTPSTLAAGTAYYCAIVSDSGVPGYHGTSGAVEVTVNSAIAVSASTSPSTIDSGQTSTLTATASGGSGTFTYAWYVGACPPNGSPTSTSSPFTTPPLAGPASDTYCIQVTDSLGGTATASTTVTVNTPLSVTASASPSTLDKGQASTVTAIASGGSGTYSIYAFYTGTCTGTALQSSSSNTYAASPASTTTYCVGVTDTLGGTATATVTVTVDADPTVSVAPVGPLNYATGQSASTLTATVSYSGPNAVTVRWYNSATPSCSSLSTSTGTTGTSFTPSTSVTGTTWYCAVVSDSGVPSYDSASNSVEVIVSSSLSVSIGPASASVDADGVTSATFTLTTAGGTGGNSYSWLYTGLNAKLGCGPADASCTVTSTSPGPYSVSVTATDSHGDTATSNTATVAVSPALSVSPLPTVSVDVGQTYLYSITASGGTGSYSYAWSLPGGVTISSGCVTSSSTCKVLGSSVGTGSITVGVTDTNGGSAFSVSAITTDPPLLVPTPTVTHNPADVGQSVTFAASPTGGSGSYTTYSWSGLPNGCTASNSATITCSPSTAGFYSVAVAVTDSNANTVTSGTLSLTVNSALSTGTLSATYNPVDVGQASTISTSGASGGTGSYTYSWTNLPPGCSSFNLASISCTPSSTSGSPLTVALTVTDGAGNTATATLSLTVDPSLTAAPSATVNPLDIGQATTISAGASGGSGTYTSYAWSGLPSGCSGSTASFSCTPASNSGTPYTVQVAVTDSNGNTVKSVFTLAVDADPTVSVSPAGGATYGLGQTATGLTATATYSGPNTVSVEWYSSATSSCSASSTNTGISGTSFTPSTSSPGTTYYCAVISDSGVPSYTSASNVVEVTVNSGLTVSASASPPGIDSGQTSALSASVSGGSGVYTYAWYAGACPPSGSSIASTTSFTTPVLTGPASDSYCVQVTDSLGASASAFTTVTVNAPISVTASASPPTIDSGQTSTLTAVPSGGSGIYTYAWYQGSSCSGLSAGNSASYTTPALTSTTMFCVEVTDSFGTSATASTSVTVNSPLTVAASASPSTVDQGQTSSISAIASGGAGTYSTYAFYTGTCAGTLLQSGSISTYTASPASTTTYCVQVTDSLGGAATNTVTITVDADPTVAVTPSGPLTYDVGQSASGFTALVTYTGPNTASVEWHSSASSSCSASTIDTGISGASFSPGTSTAGTTYYCAVVSDSGVPGYAYSSNAVEVTIDADPTVGVTPAGPLTYNVGQTATGLTATVTYTGPNTAAIEWYSSASAACGVSSTDTHASGGSFTPGTSAVGTTYYCAVVSDGGVSGYSYASNAVEVTVNAVFSASISPSSASIDADGVTSATFTLTTSGSSGGNSYSWSLSSGLTAKSGCGSTDGSCTVTSTTSGSDSVYVKVTDSNGGSATSNSAVVTVNPVLTITPLSSPVTIDVGQTYLYSITASGGTGSYSYSWSLPSGVTASSGCNTSGNTCTVQGSSVGTGAVQVTVSDTIGGSASSSSTITVNPALTASPSATPNPVDVGQVATVSAGASGGSGTYTSYAWSNLPSGCGTPGSVASFACTPVKGDDSHSPYTVQVIVTDSNGDIVTKTFTLMVNPAVVVPAPTVNHNPADAGQSVTFTAAPTGGSGTYTYTWSGLPAGCTSSNSATITCAPSTATGSPFSVVVAVTDTNGNTVTSSSLSFSVNPALSINAPTATPATIDSGQSSTLSGTFSGGTTPYSCQWLLEAPGSGSYSNLGSSSSCTSPASSTTGVLSTAGTWLFELQVADGAGVSVTSSTLSVVVNPPLTVSATASPPTIDQAQTSKLTATATGGSGTGYAYTWYPGTSCTGTALSTSNPYTTSALTSTTTYCAKATDSLGGAATTTVTVTVNPTLALTVTANPSTIDKGQTSTLTATASGGSGTYSTYAWYSGSSCTGTALQSSSSNTYTATPASTTTYCAKVTDSLGGTATNTVTVTVNSALAAGAITPASPVIDSGQSITLTAHPSGGTTPYTYQWYSGTSSTCSADITTLGTASTQSVSPTANTYYCYKVTDSTASSQSSATDLVTVKPALVAGAITPPSPTVEHGQSLTLTSHPSGGTGTYSYKWYRATSSGTCTTSDQAISGATSSTYAIPTSTASGKYYYCYIVTDTGVTQGATPAATAASATDTVYIPSLSLSKTSGATGTSTTLSGSYYVPSTSYSYCLSTSSTSVSCVSGTSSTFTSSSSGAIPSGKSLTIPSGTSNGTYYVIVYSGTTVVSSASFRVTSSG